MSDHFFRWLKHKWRGNQFHKTLTSFYSAHPQSGFQPQLVTKRMSYSPSRSISNTLMASWVLRGLNSLAGRVCLLWMPGDTDGPGSIGLMKGSAPTTDIVRLHSPLLSSPQKVSPLTCLSRARQDHLSDPARKRSHSESVFMGELRWLWFTLSFAFECLMTVDE